MEQEFPVLQTPAEVVQPARITGRLQLSVHPLQKNCFRIAENSLICAEGTCKQMYTSGQMEKNYWLK